MTALSREHHDGLLFCWKIKQGLGNGTDAAMLRNFTMWYWRYHMNPHFLREEKILLPRISDHSLAGQLKKEHDDITDLILALDKNPDKDLFSILILFVTNHIRFEERHVFGYLEKILSEDQLNTIAGELAPATVSDKVWAYPFWTKRIKG